MWDILVWWLLVFSSGNFSIISLLNLFFWNYYYFNTRTSELILHLIFSFLFSFFFSFPLFYSLCFLLISKEYPQMYLLKLLCFFIRATQILISKSFFLFPDHFFFITSCYFLDCLFFWSIINFIEFSLKNIGLSLNFTEI